MERTFNRTVYRRKKIQQLLQHTTNTHHSVHSHSHTLTRTHSETFFCRFIRFFFLLHFISLPISYGYIEHFSYLVFQPTWMLIINDSIECLDLSPCILDHFQIQSSFIFPIFVCFTANEMATISINWFIFNQLMMPFLNFFFLHLIQIQTKIKCSLCSPWLRFVAKHTHTYAVSLYTQKITNSVRSEFLEFLAIPKIH